MLNFCCPGHTPVTTDRGIVKLAELRIDDKVWDGVSFVQHEGVTYQGIRTVFEYEGVQATPEHVVFTEELGPVPLVDAFMGGLHVVRTAPGGRLSEAADGHGTLGRLERGHLERRVRALRAAFTEVDDELGAASRDELRVRGEIEVRRGPEGEHAGCTIPGDGSAMPSGHARILAELQRAWYSCAHDQGGVCNLGLGYLARGVIQRAGLRPHRQRRGLSPDEPASGNAERERDELSEVVDVAACARPSHKAAPPGAGVYGQHSDGKAKGRVDGGAHTSGKLFAATFAVSNEGCVLEEGQGFGVPAGSSAGEVLHEVRKESAGCGQVSAVGVGPSATQAGGIDVGARATIAEGISEPAVRGRVSEKSDAARTIGRGHSKAVFRTIKFVGVMPVYDVVNAGPKHRFTAYGRLVSNSSAYGASPASLERKIESDTGVKPEEGTGEKGLEAIATRQPRATEFLEEMARVPKERGYYRAASGRIRHCVLHGRNADVSWRMRNAQESALGREMRNFAMQESVASTSARACKWAQSIYRSLGMQAKVMTCLYDSLVTLCPLEERFVVNRLHTYLMSVINTWTYDDAYGKRTLQYGVDNEFNYRWSTRPSKDELADLDREDWHPTPEHLRWALTYENWELMVA